jgi:Fe-Mn family superoxide dismutase
MVHYTVSPLTLEMHYSYLSYNNLNNAIAGTEYENQSIENILSKLDNNVIWKNAGGYYNHSLYWKSKQIPEMKLAIHGSIKILVHENFVTTFKVKQQTIWFCLGLAGR